MSTTGLSDCAISACLRSRQLNWPCLPGDHFSTSAVFEMSSRGGEQISQQETQERFSARKVEVQHEWLLGSTVTCPERVPNWNETETSFPVNVYDSYGFYMTFPYVFSLFFWLWDYPLVLASNDSFDDAVQYIGDEMAWMSYFSAETKLIRNALMHKI